MNEARDYRLQTSGFINVRADHVVGPNILKAPTRDKVITVWRNQKWPENEPETQNKTWFTVGYDGAVGWMLLLHETFEGQFAEISAPIVPVAARTIDVPYFSQVASDAPESNDCGETCWKMLMAWRIKRIGLSNAPMSTTAISKLWNKELGALSWLGRDMNVNAGKMGFTTTYFAYGATNQWYKQRIDAGEPCVALITYGGLLPANRAVNYSAGHFVLVVGYDSANIIIHDPLWDTAAKGAFRKISNAEWEAASQRAGIAITGFTPLATDVALNAPTPAPVPIPAPLPPPAPAPVPVPEPAPETVPAATRALTIRIIAEADDLQADLLVTDIQTLIRAAVRIGGRMARIEIE